MPKFQSVYRANHSTETAMCRIYNDLLVARDNHLVSCVIFLDLSAAFDTVDHIILLDRLNYSFGFSNKVISWFASYLSNREQAVCVEESLSSFKPLTCGIPQGSSAGTYSVLAIYSTSC